MILLILNNFRKAKFIVWLNVKIALKKVYVMESIKDFNLKMGIGGKVLYRNNVYFFF